MLGNNRFVQRENRFKNNVFFTSKEYDSFCFNGNLKSDHYPDLKFTNFVNSREKKIYKELREICVKLITSVNALEHYFIADEIKLSGNSKINRLYQIMTRVNKKEIGSKNCILKFKNKEEPQMQFYIQNDSGKLKVILIDLYHLGIEAKNWKIGKYDLNGAYKANKKCKFDINNIANEIKEVIETDTITKGSLN